MKTKVFAVAFILATLISGYGQSTGTLPGAASVSMPGTPGVATSRAVVNVAELPALADSAGELPAFDAFAPAAGQAAQTPLLGAAPPPPPPPDNASPAPAASFLGLLQSFTDGDAPVPDTHGNIGPNHIVTSVNFRKRIQDRAGNTLRIVSSYDFWAPIASTNEYCCDDRVHYDPYENRWIVVGSTSGGTPQQATLIAVSRTSDPTGHWNLYRIQTDPTDQIYLDNPRIGFNKDWIVVEGGLYRVSDLFFVRSDIYVFSKTNLYAGGIGTFTKFQLLGDINLPNPVTTYDPSLSAVYLVASPMGPARYGVAGTTNHNELKLYSITGAVGSEVFGESATISTPFYWDAYPPGGYIAGVPNRSFLPQLGSPNKVSVSYFGSQITDAVFRNGSVWTVHSVFLPAGGSPSRTAIQWWQISPDGTVIQRGLIDDATGVNFYSDPSLSVNQFSDVLIGYSRFSSNQYASANYSFRYGTDLPCTLREDTVLKAGEAPYNTSLDGRIRWGDYSYATVDPLNDTDLWTIQEYAATPSGGTDHWGTWWGRITPYSPSISDVAIREGDFGTTNAVFTVNLPFPRTNTISLDFATTNVSALAGVDYLATNGTLIFLPSDTSHTISVPVLGDLVDETNKVFLVTLSNPTNVVLGMQSARGTIVDDDPLLLAINDPSVREGDTGTTNVLFVVTLAKPYYLPVTVDFATADGTALAGSDYVATNGTLTFAPGEISQTISVLVNGDTIDEANETFVINLTNAVNVALTDLQGRATIIDDDPLLLAINDPSVREGDTGTTNVLFVVTLAKPYYLPVTVDFATADGTALAGSDYVATNGTLTFAPGVISQPISVLVTGDTVDEANETFFINLTNAVNVALTDIQGRATIVDDDPLVLAIADSSVTEGNTGTANLDFVVTLSKPMSVPVMVDFATANSSAVAGADYVATTGTLTFNPGETVKTITVPVLGDLVDELDEVFFVNLSNAVNVVLTDSQGRATIINDDTAFVSINNASVVEGDTGQTSAIFTLSLSTTSSRTVSVRASTANGSAIAGADYLPLGNVLVSFPAGTTNQNVVVQVLGDTVMETNETFLVKLTSPANATLARIPSQATGTIMDDDFKITAVALVGADVRLNFATLSGQSYRVERTDSLVPPGQWTPVTGAENVSGTGAVVEALDPNAASQPQRFYRVRLLP